MARRRKEEQPAGIASRGIWGSRRYRRKIYGKLQLICNQYVAGGILWESAPLRCCRNEGSQTPCEIRPYTRIDFKALRKLVEPWLQSMIVATSTTVKKLPITPGTPISNAMRVGFTGERPWLCAPSNVICKTTFSYVFELTNRVMTSFTSLGPSVDCRALTQAPTYQVRTSHVRRAAFAISPRGFC